MVMSVVVRGCGDDYDYDVDVSGSWELAVGGRCNVREVRYVCMVPLESREGMVEVP